MNLEEFIETNYPLNSFLKHAEEDDKLEIINYYENAKSDAKFDTFQSKIILIKIVIF